MGRGRGKGKKQAVVSHEDQVSGGEEVILAYRRRGRPQKIFKDDVEDERIEKMEDEEEEGDDLKASNSSKEAKSPSSVKGKKRKVHAQVKENSDSNLEENDTSARSSIEEPTASFSLRPKGSRRKGIPRRAAEAGVQCV